MRAEDTFYGAVLVILLAWLVLSAGTNAPVPDSTPLDSPPSDEEAAHSAIAPPPVLAEVTVDSERFYILVGDGPPRFGVAVSEE